jgi:hypothetical protein
MPIQQGRTQAAPKKQHIVKISAAILNKFKKRKGFFFSFIGVTHLKNRTLINQ